MASEIEAKVRVTDAPAVERALSAIGARYCGAWLETDTFFDHPDRQLMRQDEALRLRVPRPLDETARRTGAPVLLTYKGPRQAGRAKIRPQYEVPVPDAEAMSTILHHLDYHETFSYEKRRRRWRLGASEVTLDDVPRLGAFVEVEAPDERGVDELLDRLGFAGAERITASYVHMLSDALGGSLDGQVLRFDGPVPDDLA